MSTRSRIDLILSAARARLHRLTPAEALEAVEHGAVVVDIRPAAQRAREGEVAAALVIERNVLEWRLDPTSAHRVDIARPGRRIVVVCNEGFSSTLAIGTLLDLGLPDVTDLRGGFQALLAAGLVPATGPEPVDLSPPPDPQRRI